MTKTTTMKQTASRQETGVWTEEHAPSFYRPSGNPVDNPSARQIIQELTGGSEYQSRSPQPVSSLSRKPAGNEMRGDEQESQPLPVSVHTSSLSPKEPAPDPLLQACPAFSSGASTAAEDPPFKNELDSLQFALQRLQLSFPRVTSIEEQLKLASAINLITASIARMVRTQKYITAHRPVEYNREVQAALEIVMKEWARTT